MITRKTALLLGVVYEEKYVYSTRPYLNSNQNYHPTVRNQVVHKVRNEVLYDFLYENNYPIWLCNKVNKLRGERSVKELIMKLHTGETQTDATPNWNWEQREQLGQQYLRQLAEDILNANSDAYIATPSGTPSPFEKLRRALELDGYIYRDGKLIASESDVLDVQEEQGILDNLYTSLSLNNLDVFRNKLKLSEEHYIAGRWSDAIANSRLVLEGVLQEVATAYSERRKATALPANTYTKPVEVRQFLEREGLLEQKEREVIQYTYGLLSNTGSHPYMAAKDQARLLRQMALTLSQFVMLRLEGALIQTS